MKKVKVGFTFRTAKGLQCSVTDLTEDKARIEFSESGYFTWVSQARCQDGASIKDPTVVASASGTVIGITQVTHDGSRKDRALSSMAKSYWRSIPKKKLNDFFLDYSNFEAWFYDQMGEYYLNQDWVMLSIDDGMYSRETTYFVDKEVADFLSCSYQVLAFRSPLQFRGYAGKKAVTATLKKDEAKSALLSYVWEKIGPHINKMTDNGRKQYQLIQDRLK